jgi:dimethylargininase
MTTKNAIHFGPRLIGSPTGTLRAAALVRPNASIENARALPGEPGAVYTRTLEQHEVLRKTLEYFGVETFVLESHGEDPYESSAVDAAVAFEDGALVMRPSAMGRRGEADRMQAEFAELDIPLAGHIAPPGLLDGSDVLLAGNTAFVGVGARGNTIGRSGFASVAQAHGYRVVEVRLTPEATSLRSVASAVAKDTILVSADRADLAAFSGFNTVVLERGEDQAAGVVCLGERHVVADVRYRTSLARMRRAGIVVEGIDLYDFEKVGITPSMLVLALKRD